MDFRIKKLTVEAKTAKITLDRLNYSTGNDQDLRALAVLLGGYNEYGRKIPLDKHRENMILFKDLIDSISSQLD